MTPANVAVWVNGEAREVEEGTTVGSLVDALAVLAGASSESSASGASSESGASGGPGEAYPAAAGGGSGATAGDGRGRRGVAVAVNEEVVPRSAWDETPVRDGDRVEVLNAAQGG